MASYFSSNLKHLREVKGYSQSKLASIIHVNQTTIARWEDDNRVPTIDNAIDVAQALKVPLSDLLGKDLRIVENHDNNTIISDEELAMRLQKISDNEGVKILFDKVGELTEQELNQVLAIVDIIKKEHNDKNNN